MELSELRMSAGCGYGSGAARGRSPHTTSGLTGFTRPELTQHSVQTALYQHFRLYPVSLCLAVSPTSSAHCCQHSSFKLSQSAACLTSDSRKPLCV